MQEIFKYLSMYVVYQTKAAHNFSQNLISLS